MPSSPARSRCEARAAGRGVRPHPRARPPARSSASHALRSPPNLPPQVRGQIEYLLSLDPSEFGTEVCKLSRTCTEPLPAPIITTDVTVLVFSMPPSPPPASPPPPNSPPPRTPPTPLLPPLVPAENLSKKDPDVLEDTLIAALIVALAVLVACCCLFGAMINRRKKDPIFVPKPILGTTDGRVQLFAAPGYAGAPDTPLWSALVIDGVTVPYEKVAGVRMDVSALEFIVEQAPRTSHVQADPPRVRVYSQSEFDLWREALYPKITNPSPDLPTQSGAAESSASAVYAASRASKKWVANSLGTAKPTSSTEEGDAATGADADACEPGVMPAWLSTAEADVGLNAPNLNPNAVDAQPSTAEEGDELSPRPSMEGIVGQDSDFPEAPPEDSAVVLPPASTNSGDTDFQSPHPSIIPTWHHASTWQEPESRANVEGIPEEGEGPEEGSSSLTIEQRTNQLEIAADFDVDGDGDIGEDGHLNRDPEACEPGLMPAGLSTAETNVGLNDNAVDAQPLTAEGGDELSPRPSMEGIVAQDSDFPEAPPEDSAVVLPPASTNSGNNDFLSRHPSIMRLQARHIPTHALDASTWHEQELRANAEGIPGEGAEPEDPGVHRI